MQPCLKRWKRNRSESRHLLRLMTVYLLELLPVLKRITQSCTRSSYCKSNSFAQRVIVETDWGASTWSVSKNLRIALPKITGASACWLEVLKCGRLGWHALADYKMEHKYGVQNGVPLKKTLEAHKRGVQVLKHANRRLRHLVPLRFHTRITHCTLHLDDFFWQHMHYVTCIRQSKLSSEPHNFIGFVCV